ncbi:MAG: hypothetical protein ACI9UU_004005 [Candidatus Azotimanducaceae bacterium]|jgi:hypothetical protein
MELPLIIVRQGWLFSWVAFGVIYRQIQTPFPKAPDSKVVLVELADVLRQGRETRESSLREIMVHLEE